MQVVGLDFGTTNVRIAVWNSDGDLPPDPRPLGKPEGMTMPAVVALRREPGGEVSIIVGEEADALYNVENEIEVVRNIKRYALSGDEYVMGHLEARNAHEENPKWPQSWWDPGTRSIHVWGQVFPVWDLIQEILAEAFSRAEVEGRFEWRAGCPVHSDLAYRDGLARAVSAVTGQTSRNAVRRIVEEPILFLTLVHRITNPNPDTRLSGSYLVYDLGGGSFDSAVVDITEDTQEMVVYGADGHPLLGGSDIDEQLTEDLQYSGQPDLLRKAKERLTPLHPEEKLADGTVVSLEAVDRAMKGLGVVHKSTMTARDAYLAAKVLWKRGSGEDDPPVGEILTRSSTGALKMVWQLTWDDLARDVDRIVLVGGPARSPGIREQLADRFGDDKITTAADLLPTLAGTPDLDLVGISMGACYSYEDSYVPWHLNRLPVHVTLEDLGNGEKAEYKAFQNLNRSFKPFSDFVSDPLNRQNATVRSGQYPQTYQVTIAYPNGLVLRQKFIDDEIEPRWIGHQLRLIIDRYGRVGVEQAWEPDSTTHRSTPGRRRTATVFQDTPWQREEQKEALQRLFLQQERYAAENQRQGFANVNRLPWQYPTP